MSDITKAEVIIVGAGEGRRMGVSQPKVFMPLGTQPVLVHALNAFSGLDEITGIVLVVPARHEDQARALCGALPGAQRVRAVVPGGARRQDSVQAGIDHLLPETELVLVHDAARPFVPPALVKRVLAAARETGAAVPGVPISDTLKQIGSEDRLVRQTFDRRNLVAVQTPQGFRVEVLKGAYAHAWKHQLTATDDAGLVEQWGKPVVVVEGDPQSFKLTTPLDYQMAEALWTRKIS
jgi:2-C-methyl-D-erythritol 4-phosphate cytidylyltransferase